MGQTIENMKIYPNSNFQQISAVSSPVFHYVEKKFNEWIESGRFERKEMYFSEDAINDKKGAIQGAIENALEEANETGKPVELSKFDIEAAFE